jgi:hypothetical protein
MQGDRATDGDTRQRDFARYREIIEQRCDIVGHCVEGDFAARLLRQSGATGVVTQHAARCREPWRDVVPAFQRAAHFVNQNQRALALTAQLTAERDTVCLNEIHSALPVSSR